MPAETATAPAAAAPPADKPTIDAPAAGERPPGDFMADIIGDLGAMDEGKPAPSIPRDDKGKFVKPAEKPAAKKPEQKPAEKPAEAPDKPAEAEAEPAEKPAAEVKPVRAAELRTAYEAVKKKVATLEPEVQSLRAKVKQFEEQKPVESGPLLEKVKALEQRNNELEQHMAFLDYQKSAHFTKKFAEPYRQAWNDAVAEFRELTVREQTGEDEMGEAVYKSRPADDNDLLRLANMKLSEMDEAATKMFGASASRAIGHIQNIKRLSAAQHRALEEAKSRSAQWESQRTAEGQNRINSQRQIWADVNKAMEEKFPKAYKADAEDAEDKAGHTKGFALADLMFLGAESLSPEQVESLPKTFREAVQAKKPLTDAQRVQLHALARLKMANHDRKVVALKKANARIKELEESLAAYEKSEPGGKVADQGASGRGESKDWLQQAEDELRAIDK